MKIYKNDEDYTTREFIIIMVFLLSLMMIWLFILLIIGGNLLWCM